MINFLTYKTLEDINGTGIQGILQTASDAVPLLPAMILFSLFIVLSFGSMFYNTRKYGSAKMSSTFAVAGFVTMVVAVMMTLIPNFINTATVVTCIIIEIAFVFWLYSSTD